jgi:hypothetical protein
MGFKPINKYLPPRAATTGGGAGAPPREAIPAPDGSAAERLFAWVDKVLSA